MDLHTVVGNVRVIKGVESPQLGNRRDLFVYLPPGYDRSTKRYPVVYMHDGQNLFDEALCWTGEWQVDETMEWLSWEGFEAIIVGIPNSGAQRLDEYSPFHDPEHGGGRGDDYLAFIVETVKPLIDRRFRTRRDRAHTGVLGSSMGGLISLYAFFRHPAVFGFVGALSPSIWFAGKAILAYLEQVPLVPGRIYVDTGTREAEDAEAAEYGVPTQERPNVALVREAVELLGDKGYRLHEELYYVEDDAAEHTEFAWACRLPFVLRFLLGGVESASAQEQRLAA